MLFYFQGDHCYSKQRFLHKSAIDGGWALDYPFSKIAKVNIGTIISSYFICLDGHGWTFRMYKYKLKLSTRKLVEKDHVEWKSCSGNEEKRWKHNAYNMPMMWNQQTNTEMDQNLILHIWLSGYHGFDPQPEPKPTWPRPCPCGEVHVTALYNSNKNKNKKKGNKLKTWFDMFHLILWPTNPWNWPNLPKVDPQFTKSDPRFGPVATGQLANVATAFPFAWPIFAEPWATGNLVGCPKFTMSENSSGKTSPVTCSANIWGFLNVSELRVSIYLSIYLCIYIYIYE